jgi:hypothetical protein
MIILLFVYLAFLFVYLAFNVYGIFRVYTMRIKGDATSRAIIIYAIAIFAVIFSSISYLLVLDW